jgi:hypothetical protein
MEWYKELEQKYIHLFEIFQGEEIEGGYYRKGDVLRGIECEEGWKIPVKKYLTTLEWLRHNRCHIINPDYNPDLPTDWGKRINTHTLKIEPRDNVIQIFQIKEKFGEVRAYTSGPKHIEADLAHALGKLESECNLRCQLCGSLHESGIVRSKSGWLHCLCPGCLDGKHV